MYGFGVGALAVVMSGLPLVVSAEDRGERDARVSAGTEQRQIDERGRPTDRVEMRDSERDESEDMEIEDRGRIHLDLEDEDAAFSFDDLKQKIEKRKHELEQEVASSSPEHKNIVENANEVRLAVHSLLSSKELLGGIGQQVSEVAKQMNDSVATTTDVEAKIQSRSFLTRLFFGGDKTSAEVIAQEAAQNQKRIAVLTELLGQATISADMQAVLKEQISALQVAQTHLQDLADKEKSAWGLFSWRF